MIYIINFVKKFIIFVWKSCLYFLLLLLNNMLIHTTIIKDSKFFLHRKNTHKKKRRISYLYFILNSKFSYYCNSITKNMLYIMYEWSKKKLNKYYLAFLKLKF